MSDITDLETCCAHIAVQVVTQANGFITFDRYDAIMRPRRYFAPINWIAGRGDITLWKQNNDKLCAFAACRLGLLEQTDKGYRLVG